MKICIASYPKRRDWCLVEDIARMTANLPEKDTPPTEAFEEVRKC